MKLVIFDLDGTLINSLSDLGTAVNVALQNHGFPGHPLADYRFMVGNGVSKLLERALPPGEHTPENIERIRPDFMAYYGRHKQDLTAPYPEISELLAALKQRGVLLAVASNKFHSATQALVKAYFGEDTFAAIYGLREEVPAKPAPDIVYTILEETGISASEALYVGDSGVDMQTAANSGVISVGVLWGYRGAEELMENGACHLVETPSAILGLVD